MAHGPVMNPANTKKFWGGVKLSITAALITQCSCYMISYDAVTWNVAFNGSTKSLSYTTCRVDSLYHCRTLRFSSAPQRSGDT